MADLETTSPDSAYATKPNILVPKSVGAIGKAGIEARAVVELQNRERGHDTVGRKPPMQGNASVSAITTTQET